MIGIYKITSPTGKVYIGQSWEIENRWKHYKRFDCKEQPKLYNSLVKHGIYNHQFEVVHELPDDVEQEVMDNYEVLYWQQYTDCGVEMLNTKEPGKGGRHSDETKKKMSEAKKGEKSICFGKKQSKELIEKRRLAVIGSKRTDETKKKMSDAQKGEKSFWFGKIMSDETKRKMSVSRINYNLKNKNDE